MRQVQLPQVGEVGEVDGDLGQPVEGQVDGLQHVEVGDDGIYVLHGIVG